MAEKNKQNHEVNQSLFAVIKQFNFFTSHRIINVLQ